MRRQRDEGVVIPHASIRSKHVCSHAPTSSRCPSADLGNFAIQRSPCSSRMDAFGRAPPRLDPASRRSRMSTSISWEARSAELSRWGRSISRGTPVSGAVSTFPSASHRRRAPWRVSSFTPVSRSVSNRVRGVLPAFFASKRSARVIKFLPQRSGIQSSSALRDLRPAEWKEPPPSGTSGASAKASSRARYCWS